MYDTATGILVSFFWSLVFLGAVFLVVWITTSFSGQVKQENIIEVWSTLLPGQAKKKDQYFELVKEQVGKHKLPFDIKIITIGSLIKDDYIAIPQDNGYCVYIGAVPEGTDLHVNWSLEEKNALGCLTRIPLLGFIITSMMKTHEFNIRNRAKAFASVTLECAAVAAEQIADSGNLHTKIRRESSGRLGPL